MLPPFTWTQGVSTVCFMAQLSFPSSAAHDTAQLPAEQLGLCRTRQEQSITGRKGSYPPGLQHSVVFESF